MKINRQEKLFDVQNRNLPQKNSNHKNRYANSNQSKSHRSNRPPRVRLQINLRNVVAKLLLLIRKRAPWTHNALRRIAWIHNLISCAIEAMPTTTFTFDIFHRLTALARQAANTFGWFWLFVIKLNVFDVEMQLSLLVLADFHPLIFSHFRLLEVNYVVASGAVAVVVEAEFVVGEAFELHLTKVFEKLGAFCWLHCFT